MDDERSTQALLRTYGERAAPTPTQQDHAWAGITAALAMPSGGAGGSGAALKGVLGVGIAIGIGLAVWVANRSTDAPTLEPAAPSTAAVGRASAPTETILVDDDRADEATAPPASVSTEADTTSEARAPRPSTSGSARRAEPQAAPTTGEIGPISTGGTLAEEVALMGEARAALARGDATAALAALDRHADRFPHGTLASERDVVRITALCDAGRDGEARIAAAAAGTRPAVARALSRCWQP